MKPHDHPAYDSALRHAAQRARDAKGACFSVWFDDEAVHVRASEAAGPKGARLVCIAQHWNADAVQLRFTGGHSEYISHWSEHMTTTNEERGRVVAETMREIDELVNKIKPLLAGKGGGVQSLALAELTALWLLGLRPDLREAALDNWITYLRETMKVTEQFLQQRKQQA